MKKGYTIKKGRIFGAILLIVITLLMLVFTETFMQKISAYAQDDLRSANSIISDKQVESSGYLYNFDGSADYIYADFSGSTGYAIFAEESMELLEYATVGDFPYSQVNGELVYGGPRAYFNKSANQFVDIISNEQFVLATDEMETISQTTRQKVEISAKTVKSNTMLTAPSEKLQNFISQNILGDVSKSTKSGLSNSAPNEPQNPPLDENNWISPTAGATYIDNSAYFLTAGQTPMHGNNTTGTCTAVATQLMLSYNNFYNDRRIIAPQHLYGGWNVNGNGNIFDHANYTKRDWNPNVSTNYASMTSRTLGSNQAYHDLLVNNGITGFLHDAEGNLRTHLNGRLGANNFVVDCQEATTFPFGWGNWKTIASKNILAEINANRPVVIATGSNINGTDSNPNVRDFDHAVIAYGYQTFAAYEGIGNSTDYLGYIVNMGWNYYGGTGTTTNIWTNSAWYCGYLKLEVNNHTHNYNTWVGGNFGEARCGVCGHRSNAFTTTESDGNITITGVRSGITLTRSVTIPSTINGLPVTAIGNSAFANQNQMSQITIPASITSIGDNAFQNCYMLKEMIIPNSVTSIGNGAFQSCFGLTSLILPNSIITIEYSTFLNCFGLINIIIPNTVTSIGKSAFRDCSNLTNIEVPDGVTSIGFSAFAGCTRLNSITLPFVGNVMNGSANTHFGYIFGAQTYYTQNNNIPYSLREVVITGGDKINSNAFLECRYINSISLPASIKYIDQGAFENCYEIENINFSQNSLLQYIGVRAFNECHSLSSIILPVGLKNIGDSAFYNCYQLSSVDINPYTQLDYIGGDAFTNCRNLINISIPIFTLRVSFAFYETGIWNNTPDNSIVYVGDWAVGYKGELSNNLIIKDNSVGIGYSAFAYSEIVTATMPDTLKKIEEEAFNICNNLKAVIFKGQTNIYSYAFEKNTNIKFIVPYDQIEYYEQYLGIFCSNIEYLVDKHNMKVTDYNYAQQYYFYEISSNHNLAGHTISTKRLRAGFIEKEYIVLSPRRAEAGIAYIEYNVVRPISNITVDLALWSASELLRPSDCTAVFQYKDNDGNWNTKLDLLNDISLTTDRTNPVNYNIVFDDQVTEFRFYLTSPPIGASSNTGRFCIGDMNIYYI